MKKNEKIYLPHMPKLPRRKLLILCKRQKQQAYQENLMHLHTLPVMVRKDTASLFLLLLWRGIFENYEKRKMSNRAN